MPFHKTDWNDSKRGSAEDIVQADLQRSGLHRGLCTNIGIRFTRQEVEKYRVFGTNVDGIWTLQKGTLIYYLDGEEVHGKTRQDRRDRAIDACLRERGRTVIRYVYKPAITKKARNEFLKLVETELKRLGYFNGEIIYDDGE